MLVCSDDNDKLSDKDFIPGKKLTKQKLNHGILYLLILVFLEESG